MALPRFYVGPQPLCSGLLSLSGPEARHAHSVLRLSPRDEVLLFDGAGGEGRAVVHQANKQEVEVEVSSVVRKPCDVAMELTLAVSVPKGARQDDLIEKCTELGMMDFWPMVCERSVAEISERRLAKWNRIAVEACKQSQRAWLPRFHPPQPFGQVMARGREFSEKWIAHPNSNSSLAFSGQRPERVLLLIGPEGGFTERELASALDAGFFPLSLGRTILRIETAAIVGMACLLNR